MLWSGRKVFLLILFTLYFLVDVYASKMMHENDDKNFNSKLNECDCGEHSIGCRLDEFNETLCSCRFGYAQKKGICQACDCGENSTSCQFQGSNKICYCRSGYAERNETCQVCDCGEHSTNCRFRGSSKICHCRSGYAERYGTCEVCDCGEHSTNCWLVGNDKICSCPSGYADKNGTCQECDCGEHSVSCRFQNDTKTCICDFRYAERNGICQVCSCGDHAVRCFYNDDDNKVCWCRNGYIDINGTCTECRCGEAAYCEKDENDNIKCVCIKGYVYRSGKCVEACSKDDDCRRNEMCKREGNSSFCACKPNFKGKNCEINELCDGIESLCRSKGAICEIVNSIPECKCPPGKSLRLLSGICQGACNMDTCLNGDCEEDGMGSYKCICNKGFTGKRCEEKTEKHDNNHLLTIIFILDCIALLLAVFGTFYIICWK